MTGLYGYSADCIEDDHEHCEQPDGCDCDCHLADPEGQDDVQLDEDGNWPEDGPCGPGCQCWDDVDPDLPVWPVDVVIPSVITVTPAGSYL